MYPISDLTAFCRKTTGDVPPKLVGASTTVVGSKMYLYGGRLVSERKMVSDIYMFDLETFKWERVSQFPEDDIPQARYFHSADTWRNHLIIFGGMAIKPQSDNPEDLCVLNDVRLFDLSTRHWLPPAPIPSDSSLVPNARYAHLSSVTADRLFIIGGQDLANVWLDDIYIFDLVSKTWIQRRDYPRHCGTYRSVAVTAEQRVRLPQDELRGQTGRLGQPGTRFNIDKKAPAAPNATQGDALIHLPYSTAPTDEYPCDIFLFSNYNFTDVQRELEVFTPLSDGDFTVSDRSSSMTGTSFPPGLRFPTGAILGTFFIVAGTYLSQTYQSFSIWALDLINMTWSRIDPGSALASGSWFRSCLWASANKFVVFGNRHGNLVEDYNRRLLSWDHVTCIDLEAFGIYQPPGLMLDIPMQELGLAALEEGLMADFEIVCDDGRRIKVSRKLLEDRWPWFKDQRKLFLQAASRALEALPSMSSQSPLPEVPTANRQEQRPDPRLTARTFNLSEPYPITLAFMQYFYSMSLITPLQHAPAVLSQLLLLSSTYQLGHLQSLVKHAMHRALSYATSVGIYGVSTLCSCRSLQIRALRVVMAYSQKRPGGVRSKADKDAGPGGGRNSDASGGSGGGGRFDNAAARPRGMSDASYMRGGASDSSTGARGFARGTPISESADGEPLAVLADLQEFGLPGQDMPLPQVGNPSPKRVSEMSMALPPLSEDSLLDFSAMPSPPVMQSSTILGRPAPPTAPLPSPPSQQSSPKPKRMDSVDSLVIDSFGDRDVVTIKSLPVPRPRRMASMDTISSNSSSSREARSERGQMSPVMRQVSPSPPPMLHPQALAARNNSRFSVMSHSTEQDLLAIAEMLSPTVDMATAEEEPIPDGPPLAELEPFSEMSIQEVDEAARNAIRDSLGSSVSSLYSSYQQRQSAWAATSMRSSMYTDSDGASYMGDDPLPDPAFLVPGLPQNYRNLSLPRGSLPMPPLDDSRSLSSSTSYSSLRTPSLSRTSSLAYLSSPPISPASSYSPIDGSGTSSPHTSLTHQGAALLGVIGEEPARHEHDHYHQRSPSGATETVNFENMFDDESSSPNGPPSSYFDRRPNGPGTGGRSITRVGSRGELRSQPPSRSASRNEMRSPPPQGPPPTRRVPELQRLQISNGVAPSLSSAPTPDLNAPSPFGPRRSPYELQTRSAHPSNGHMLPFAPDQRSSLPSSSGHGHSQPYGQEYRSSLPTNGHGQYASEQQQRTSYTDKRSGMIAARYDGVEDQQSHYSREMQSPFGNMRQPHSAEQHSPMYPGDQRTAPHTPSTPSSFATMTMRTTSDREPTRLRQESAPQPPPTQPPPPVPLSPVLSASSGSSGRMSVVGKSSIGAKLFGRKKSSDKSSDGTSSLHHSNRSVSSLEMYSKTDEKRLKKEAAKARTERLAQDLAEKARKRAEAAKAKKESAVKEKAKKPWEEGGGMYEGIAMF